MTASFRLLHCAAFGVPFQLAAESGPLLAAMLERAPLGTVAHADACADARRFAVRRAGRGDGHRLLAGDAIVAKGAEPHALLDQLGRELMVYVADHAPDRVFLHAGVVGWRGRALVLPGASFAGKTTLVAELVRAGASYYSDEYAVIDPQGWVHPYARALQMREDGRTEQRAVTIEDLNGSEGRAALPVSRVVFTGYMELADWQPEPLSAGMAVLEMLRHTIPVRRAPGRVMATLAVMMERATAWRCARGEASEAARELLAAMDAGGGGPR